MLARKFWIHLLCAGALMPLAACQTSFDEFRQNISEIKMPTFSREQPQEEAVVSLDGIHACPNVSVVPDLGTLHEFTDVERPSDTTLVSAVTMNVERTSCVYSQEHGSVAVQMTVAFDSRLGPRSKIYKGDKPNFAYPYFLAVTSPSDEIVAKEVFAASVAYESDQNAITHRETLRQIVPLENPGDGPNYAILIGFQLTDDQLAYNRMLQQQNAPQPVATPWTPESPVTSVTPSAYAPVPAEPVKTPAPAVRKTGFAVPPAPAPAKPTPPQRSRDPIGASLRNEAQAKATAPQPAAAPAPAKAPAAAPVQTETPTASAPAPPQPAAEPPSSGLEPAPAPVPATGASEPVPAPTGVTQPAAPEETGASETEETSAPAASPTPAPAPASETKPAVVDLTEPAL